MTVPQRSLRLLAQHTEYLDRNSFTLGEVFYDTDNGCLRIMDGRTSAGIKIATQPWVQNNLTTINNNINLTDSTNSTSTTTGSLIVTGGTGISGTLNVGGITKITNSTTSTSTTTGARYV